DAVSQCIPLGHSVSSMHPTQWPDAASQWGVGSFAQLTLVLHFGTQRTFSGNDVSQTSPAWQSASTAQAQCWDVSHILPLGLDWPSAALSHPQNVPFTHIAPSGLDAQSADVRHPVHSCVDVSHTPPLQSASTRQTTQCPFVVSQCGP